MDILNPVKLTIKINHDKELISNMAVEYRKRNILFFRIDIPRQRQLKDFPCYKQNYKTHKDKATVTQQNRQQKSTCCTPNYYDVLQYICQRRHNSVGSIEHPRVCLQFILNKFQLEKTKQNKIQANKKVCSTLGV